MESKRIPKSELLKNVPIETINEYRDTMIVEKSTIPIHVLEDNNQYYILDGLEEVLASHYNNTGDDLIECIVKKTSEY